MCECVNVCECISPWPNLLLPDNGPHYTPTLMEATPDSVICVNLSAVAALRGLGRVDDEVLWACLFFVAGLTRATQLQQQQLPVSPPPPRPGSRQQPQQQQLPRPRLSPLPSSGPSVGPASPSAPPSGRGLFVPQPAAESASGYIFAQEPASESLPSSPRHVVQQLPPPTAVQQLLTQHLLVRHHPEALAQALAAGLLPELRACTVLYRQRALQRDGTSAVQMTAATPDELILGIGAQLEGALSELVVRRNYRWGGAALAVAALAVGGVVGLGVWASGEARD